MINLLIIIIFISVVLYLSKLFIHRMIMMNKYKIILEIQDYFLLRSYDMVYNDQIIGYASNGVTNIPKEELETIERNFINLSFELMGKTNVENCISFYGSRDSFIKNMLIFFTLKLINDRMAKIFQEQQNK